MTIIKKLYWILHTQVGIDPRKMLQSLRGFSRYIDNFFQFRTSYKGRLEFMPCLQDWYEEGGTTKSEYFWQDLFVARKIFKSKPKTHVDIGSRVDGFVSHVASFREIEVFDVRPITSQIPGVKFKQANLMEPLEVMIEYCDSLSCLHALEHFGLGRYGDPIDPFGHETGLRNMVKILQQDGLFYLSVPIGIARVEFNAHRVFDPREIIRLAEDSGLFMEGFAWVQSGVLTESINLETDFDKLGSSRYALGIFTFRKKQVIA
ncbi:MAG: DUF268 domain-containing protein [Methylococcaceae bacterium]